MGKKKKKLCYSVVMDLRSLVESAHDSAGRVGMREQLYLASAPAIRRSARFFSLCKAPASPGGA